MTLKPFFYATSLLKTIQLQLLSIYKEKEIEKLSFIPMEVKQLKRMQFSAWKEKANAFPLLFCQILCSVRHCLEEHSHRKTCNMLFRRYSGLKMYCDATYGRWSRQERYNIKEEHRTWTIPPIAGEDLVTDFIQCL